MSDRRPSHDGARPVIWQQVVTRLLERYRDDRRLGDVQLPPIRDVAQQPGVGINTVKRAYRALDEEGLLERLPRRATILKGAGRSAPNRGDPARPRSFDRPMTPTGRRQPGQRRLTFISPECGDFHRVYWQRLMDGLLEKLLRQRDFIVQKYEGNTIIGYNFINVDAEKPGPTKWAWPTVNYHMAQLIAAQHHHAGGFWPSYRPALQFMTRYSRFIWARDIKAVSVDDVDKKIQLDSPEKIWWRRLVYTRKRQDGHDLIVHLLRIPPTEKWDLNWADEPLPLKGVTMTVAVGDAGLQTVLACRPYDFEEPQQVVQKTLAPSATSGKITVTVPPFRYHTMVVLRIEEPGT
jgi:regulatory GntR family protein